MEAASARIKKQPIFTTIGNIGLKNGNGAGSQNKERKKWSRSRIK